MANPIRRTLRNSRDRFLLHVIEAIGQLNDRLNDRLNELDYKVTAINQSQLQSNHYQLATYNELTEKVRNSGVMYVSDSEVVAKIFTGQKIYLDPKDISVTPHLALDAIWEGNITKAWLKVVQPTDVIMDIGANFGYYGVIAAQQTDKKVGKVILFEANPNLIPYMNKTLSANWINEQSVVENLAVADKTGKITLNIMKDYIGSSSVLSAEHMDEYMHGKMHVEAEEKVLVKAVSIDDYCKRNNIAEVNLIKMDIEGFEDKAYQGMREIVKASSNITMFIEFTKNSYNQPEQFYEQLLADFGHVYVINEEGQIIKPKKADYQSIVGYAEDWVMPIFSKNSNLSVQ